ncbi:hypothetical protein ATEIFO6365_0001069700 [Aspergillus terreus]|uniref:Uncharacterized protein n=1 Tax=Aspergillus terreus TaxID=33178 RepID=A0A5M3YM11_ASPTE|nr:hypothetical protein ATETN484_0001061800 [Aspergillus terreus]GFF12474.1 hypothetical protein ATEIFO6365_0001069700 [Aspergillus terreus]
MASVPSASVFSLPLPSWQQPPSVRVAKYEPKKRKKTDNDWGDDNDDLDGETTDAASEAAPPAPSLTLSPEEAHQYRIAGLSFDREIPGGLFPHAPAKEDTSSFRVKKQDIFQGLSSLSSPIYPPQSAAQQGNLRIQHLAVLSSILHRCLLQRDYIRAGRAWGLILREEFHGVPVDARTESRWGIGAEILLRKGRQIADNALGPAAQVGESHSTDSPRLYFTRKGFEDAKEYYERLMVQHPFRKTSPDSICSLQFYPAMFSLWVYVVQEESVVARQTIENSHESSPEAMSEDEGAATDSEGHHGVSSQRKQGLLAGVRKSELGEAQKIAARLDELLVSPPYSDSPELLELRGMIALWIADLFISSVPNSQGYDVDSDSLDQMETDLHDSIQSRRELRLAIDKRQSELGKAREFFEKAKKRNKGMSSTFRDLHIDDKEVE